MINTVFKEDKSIKEYGIEVGDVLINGSKAIKMEPHHMYRNFVNLNGEVVIFRQVNTFSMKYIGSIYVERLKDFVKKLHPQQNLTVTDLKFLIDNIDSNWLNKNSPTIAYAYKKGKGYKIKKVSIATLKMNFDNIVNVGSYQNFYWLDVPDIEYTKQAWYKMSKRQKRDFETWLENK